MKFDDELLSLFVWHSALQVGRCADGYHASGELLPGVPFVVAWSAQWVVAVTLRGKDADAASGECLHGAKADMGLLASFRPPWLMLRHQATQRTSGAAVGLLDRQLNEGVIAFGHEFIFL
jgi:hypothetical protein